MDPSRREFLGVSVQVGTSVMVFGCSGGLLFGCGKKMDAAPSSGTPQLVTLSLANEPTLATVGGYAIKTLQGVNGGSPVLVVRTGAQEFKTLSSSCTHEGGKLTTVSSGTAVCNLHGGQFSIAATNFGAAVGGPPTTAASTFGTTFNAATGVISIQG